MIEQILKGKNIRSACKQVVSNKGSAGVDGMTARKGEKGRYQVEVKDRKWKTHKENLNGLLS